MKVSKRIWGMLLAVTMLFSTGMQPALAANMNESASENRFIVFPMEYQSVAAKIAAAHEETVVQQEEGNIHYYWGINGFVVQDNSGYYFVEINEEATQFTVNGKAFEITKCETATNIGAITYSDTWGTMFDINQTFDVGGMPLSVVGGLIGSALGSAVPSGGVSTIVGAVLGTLAGTYLNGVFPIDYKLTVIFLKQVRLLVAGNPSVLEYNEEFGVYSGPVNDLYETELYYNTKTYTDEYYEYSLRPALDVSGQ